MPNLGALMASVNWGSLGILSAIVFIAALITSFLPLIRRRFMVSLVTTVLFAALYIVWVAYLKDKLAISL